MGYTPQRYEFCCFEVDFSKKSFIFVGMSDIDDIIQGGGLVFRGAPKAKPDQDKVKTKAKKKKYITGAHGSGSARQKAKYRQQRANRHKNK